MSTLKTNAIQTTSGKPILNSTGSVLQVVQSVYSGQFAAAPGATIFATLPISLSITPQSTSSKILLTVDIYLGAGAFQTALKCFRNGTLLVPGNTAGLRVPVSFYSNSYPSASPQYQVIRVGGSILDSPATTSAISYTFSAKDYSTNGIYMNRSLQHQNTGDYDHVGSSMVTAMEISG